jgi:hypothetical protein
MVPDYRRLAQYIYMYVVKKAGYAAQGVDNNKGYCNEEKLVHDFAHCI